ncbi:hypothetical protein B0H11DRAFT_1901363 [Mycena galericulata]|nr:hypothetical protein B0H11DRAFT_1901363 [Mycena galericulata]
MHASLVRRSLGGLVPPKIATPKLVSGDSTGPLGPLVAFYSKLPKGPAPVPAFRGIKARWFSGKNASAGPVLPIASTAALSSRLQASLRNWTHMQCAVRPAPRKGFLRHSCASSVLGGKGCNPAIRSTS